MLKRISLIGVSCLVSAVAMAETNTAAVSAPLMAAETGVMQAPALGQAVEKQAGTDEPRTLWVHGGDGDDKQGDKVEVKKVLEKAVKTIKVQNLVPPIHFASGEAEIPDRLCPASARGARRHERTQQRPVAFRGALGQRAAIQRSEAKVRRQSHAYRENARESPPSISRRPSIFRPSRLLTRAWANPSR